MSSGSDIYSIIGIYAHKQTILDPPSLSGLSFARNCVNGISVERRIDKMRHCFQRKPLEIMGISEKNSLMIRPLVTLTLTDMNYSELRGRKWGTSQEENVLSILVTM